MRKTIFKTICVFTLVFAVMSMTGAASTCTTKTDAINDAYSISLRTCPNTSYCFNYATVLKNDKGCNLQVTTTGTIKTKLGGTVTMKSNGAFCYKAPAKCCSSCGTCTDSFTYCVKGTNGSDCATVTLKLKCPCSSSSCTSCSSCSTCSTC